MQFKLHSFAKPLLALCLATSSISLYFGQTWTAENNALKRQAEKMESSDKDTGKLNTELSEILTPDSREYPLEKIVSEVVLHLMNSRVKYGISVSNAAPDKVSSNGSFSRLAALSDTVKGTNVKSVKINLSGTYSTYQGLLGYLETLKEFPVAIVRLKVEEQSFEMAVRIYGKE